MSHVRYFGYTYSSKINENLNDLPVFVLFCLILRDDLKSIVSPRESTLIKDFSLQP